MRHFLIKNKFIIVSLFMFIIISSVFCKIVQVSVSRQNVFTIVIDAGHGGRDGGAIGVNGTIEKEINLEYALALKDKLVEKGYKVILTRKNDDGLYSTLDKNKKLSDMQKRFNIINDANPNLVISIHMNSFSQSEAKGAVTYYRKGDSASKNCADLIQKSLKKFCDAKIENGKVGYFYMLNCSYYTAVLIECGFLSNTDEEKKLNTKEYKNQIVDAIYNGVLLYFGNAEI